MSAARLRVAARLLVIVVLLLPLAFVLAGSLRPVGVPPPSGLELLPPQPGLTAYDRLAEVVPLGRLVANSVAVVAVAMVTTICSPETWKGETGAKKGEDAELLLLHLPCRRAAVLPSCI